MARTIQVKTIDSGLGTAVRFLAALFCGLALVPSGAHLAELTNKMALPPQDYMTVQAIYAGWALFGIVVFGALALTLLHTVLLRHQEPAFWWSLLSFLCIAGTQVVFWIYTYPMNVLTANWTQMPPDLEAARVQWEYSHAASAVLNFIALVAVLLALVLTPESDVAN